MNRSTYTGYIARGTQSLPRREYVASKVRRNDGAIVYRSFRFDPGQEAEAQAWADRTAEEYNALAAQAAATGNGWTDGQP